MIFFSIGKPLGEDAMCEGVIYSFASVLGSLGGDTGTLTVGAGDPPLWFVLSSGPLGSWNSFSWLSSVEAEWDSTSVFPISLHPARLVQVCCGF